MFLCPQVEMALPRHALRDSNAAQFATARFSSAARRRPPVDFAQYDPRADSCSIRYIFPNGVLDWVHFPTSFDRGQMWYDYCNDAGGQDKSDVINKKQFDASADFILELIEEEKRSIWLSERMARIVEDEDRDLDYYASRIIVGGNSQGSTVAGEVAIRYGAAHAIPLAGYLILRGLFLEQSYLREVPEWITKDLLQKIRNQRILGEGSYAQKSTVSF